MNPAAWHRMPSGLGYYRADGAAIIERGAPMTCGGTAWLVWFAEPVERVDTHMAPKHAPYTDPTRQGCDHDFGLPFSWLQWFVHRNDAGSLAEAKATVERVLERRAAVS